MNSSLPISRNLLIYLAKIPARLAQCQNLTPDTRRLLAELCLDWGNCLLWIQPHLEPDGPRHEQPLSEHAQTIWALGKQFRAVGLALWDAPPVQSETEQLRHEVSNLTLALERIERQLASAAREKGEFAV